MKKLASIPENNGKRIVYSNGVDPMIVEDQMCESCENPATAVYQGETDSFGFEPIVLCDDCANSCSSQEDEHLQALDVEDRQAEPGKAFFFSATTNIDSHHSFHLTTFSLREMTAYYRRCEDIAAALGGLYPREGFKELTPTEARTDGYKVPRWVDEAVVKQINIAFAKKAELKRQADEKAAAEVIERCVAVFPTKLARYAKPDVGVDPEFTKLAADAYASEDPIGFLNAKYAEGFKRGWVADILGVLLVK